MSLTFYYGSGSPPAWRVWLALEHKGVAYDEIDVTDPTLRMDMIQRAHGRRTVPQIFIGERHVGGYDDLSALERRGQLDPLLA